MRPFRLILSALVLLLAGCTGKVIMVTSPANLSFKIDQVKAQKVRFTVSIDNADAYYGYFIANLEMEEENFSQMSDKQLADLWLEIEKLNYESRTSFEPYNSTLVDVSCYRGSRTLKDTYLSRDNSYRLIVFQVNPKDFTIIGDIKGETFHTPAVEMKDVDFTFQVDGSELIIIPSDSECTYYWDFESEDRIFDDYLSPYSYLFYVVDMYEDYGFMGNVLSKGPVRHDMAREHLNDDTYYNVVAAAYDAEQGEICSEYRIFEFVYKDGTLHSNGYWE